MPPERPPNPYETLRLVPFLRGLSKGRLAAIADQMVDGRWYEAGETIETDELPEGGLRMLAAGGLALLRVVQAQAYNQEGWVETAGAPVMFGGAIIQSESPRVLPDLEVVARERSYVFVLDQTHLEAIRLSSAWKHAPHAWARLVTTARISSLLRASPDFHRLGRKDRHALAARMRLRTVHAGTQLISATAPCDSMYVLGRGCLADVVRKPLEGAEVKMRPLGYGTVVGARALGARTYLGALLSHDTYQEEATITETGIVAELPGWQVRALRRSEKWFCRFADSVIGCWDDADRIVRALRKNALLEGLEVPPMYELVQGAYQLVWRVEAHPPPPIGQTAGLLVVVDGELLDHRLLTDNPEDGKTFVHFEPVETFRDYDVAGEESFVLGNDAANHLRPRVPSRVVFISEHRFYDVFGHDLRFVQNRAALGRRIKIEREARAEFQTQVAPRLNVCLIEPLDRESMTRTTQHLAAALAIEIFDQFEEPVCVVELDDTATGVTRTQRGGVTWIVSGTARHPPPMALVLALDAMDRDVVHVLVLPAERMELRAVREVVDHIVFVNAGRFVDWPTTFTRRTPFVYTALLPPRGTLTFAGGNPFPPSTVRLRLDLAPLESETQDTFGQRLWAANRPDFARWARGVTDRRVGVALGGGGAWGYAHIAVLNHLNDHGVPVDVVTGSSFGAVVGAFYCALGLEGLELLLASQRKLGLATTASYVTGLFLERLINEALDYQHLEELEVPFLPICTDLVTASQIPLLAGTVGYGVRASGSLPPLFAPTITPSHTYVDGGLSSNVPAVALQTEGARLIISSDIVPPPRAMAAGYPLIGGTVGEVLRDLNLVRRMKATFQGSQTMFNTAGELSAAVAPVHFESLDVTTLPFIFTQANEIIDGATTEPTFWAAVQNATAQWERLRTLRPR